MMYVCMFVFFFCRVTLDRSLTPKFPCYFYKHCIDFNHSVDSCRVTLDERMIHHEIHFFLFVRTCIDRSHRRDTYTYEIIYLKIHFVLHSIFVNSKIESKELDSD